MREVWVTPLDEMDETLAASRSDWLVQFAAPGQTFAEPQVSIENRYQFAFHDIAEPRDGYAAVEKSQVETLIALLRKWDKSGDVAIVLQCWMGVSRSTAAAALALSLSSLERPASVARRMRQAAPFATPNPRVIAFGDELLGLDGHLISAIGQIGRGAETGRGRPFCLKLDP